jgi:hypothetical protein
MTLSLGPSQTAVGTGSEEFAVAAADGEDKPC